VMGLEFNASLAISGRNKPDIVEIQDSGCEKLLVVRAHYITL
jgi:hypothetical protein